MVVSHGENGYSAYCFRCGPVGFEPHGYRTLEELARINELNDRAKEAQSHELPEDFTTSIPEQHLRWLLRAGITPSRARSLRIGYSDQLTRIVLPVYDGDRLVYWQARALLHGQKPKYINPEADKSTILYWARPAAPPAGEVVVTEDILSAIRVGAHVTAACIMGTKTSDAQAAQLARFDRVSYWLDPDDAGREGNRKGCRKLGLVTSVREIVSHVDPKNLPDREIRELLGLAPNHRYSYHE
jgi:DNA primase